MASGCCNAGLAVPSGTLPAPVSSVRLRFTTLAAEVCEPLVIFSPQLVCKTNVAAEVPGIPKREAPRVPGIVIQEFSPTAMDVKVGIKLIQHGLRVSVVGSLIRAPQLAFPCECRKCLEHMSGIASQIDRPPARHVFTVVEVIGTWGPPPLPSSPQDPSLGCIGRRKVASLR